MRLRVLAWLGLLALQAWGCTTSPPPPSELELLPSARDVLAPPIEPLDTNMDGTIDRYQAAFPPVLLEGGRVLSRTVAYEEQAGQYRGALSLRFEPARLAPSAYAHVETIPKAFAGDASELTYGFSATVLEADPVLEIELAEGEAPNLELVCETVVADAPAALDAAQQVSAEYASYECNGLSGQPATDCWLAAILRYPTTAVVQDYLTRCDANDTGCAAAHALATGEWAAHCDGLPRQRDVRRCYYEIFNTFVDQDCSQRADPAAIAECMHAEWERIGDADARNQLCFNLELLNGLRWETDWLGFMERCLGDQGVGACDALAGELRTQCIASVARVAGDLAICDLLTGDERTYCRASYLYELSASPADCEPFRSEPELYDSCNAGLAVGLGDPARCLEVADPELRNRCIVELVALVPADVSVCDGVLPDLQDETPDTYRRTAHDACVLLTLTHPGAPIENCDRMEDREWRAWCRLGMAIRGDALVGACTTLESPVLECVCLALVGAARGERAACEQIALEAARAACVTAVLRNDGSAMHDAVNACMGQCTDRDGDGAESPQGCNNFDCDDDDRDVYPDAPEDCDNDVDDDCDDLVDCDDLDQCATAPGCEPTTPTDVVFTEHSGRYAITLHFPEGQGSSYRFVPEAELGMSVYGTGELVEVSLPRMPREPALWDAPVPVVVSVAGTPGGSWRVYAASNPSDPASRNTTTYWQDTTTAIPMRGDRYYWLYFYPTSGNDVQEIVQLRGAL